MHKENKQIDWMRIAVIVVIIELAFVAGLFMWATEPDYERVFTQLQDVDYRLMIQTFGVILRIITRGLLYIYFCIFVDRVGTVPIEDYSDNISGGRIAIKQFRGLPACPILIIGVNFLRRNKRPMICKGIDSLIIIPDVHGRPFWRYPSVTYREAHFIFLGDYLDPYPEDHIKDANAFQRLQDIVAFKRKNPERVTLLWGNHELHYLCDSIIKGSRYDEEHAARNREVLRENQDCFQMAYEETINGKRFLFTHAGVGKQWLRSSVHLAGEELTADWLNENILTDKYIDTLNDVSELRGGDGPFGSMIWADAHEYYSISNQIAGLTQVFGHTNMERPLRIQDNVYCLDCGCAFMINRDGGQIYEFSTNTIV